MCVPVQAYSLVDREVGYCQGSAFIVGLLLMQVGGLQPDSPRGLVPWLCPTVLPPSSILMGCGLPAHPPVASDSRQAKPQAVGAVGLEGWVSCPALSQDWRRSSGGGLRPASVVFPGAGGFLQRIQA